MPSSHIVCPASRDERLRVAQRDLGQVQRALLLQRRGQREQERGDQREGRRHDTSLRCAWATATRSGGNRVATVGRCATSSSTAAGRSTTPAGDGRSTSPGTSRARRSSTSSATSPRRRAGRTASAAGRRRLRARGGAAGIGAGRLRRRLRHARRRRAALVAAAPLRPRRLRVIDLDAWRGPLTRAARSRPSRRRSSRASATRRHDRARRARRAPRRARRRRRAARRRAGAASRTRSTSVPGRIPGALNAPWNEPVPELPAGRARRLLRLGRHRVRHAAPPAPRRARGTPVPGLVVGVGAARRAPRERG